MSILSRVLCCTLLCSTCLLTGCTGMFTNEARCAFRDQGGCQSVGAVDAMVKNRQFTEQGGFVQQAHNSGEKDKEPKKVTLTKPPGWNSPTPYAGQPLRAPEQIADLWIAPWVDTTGVRHGSSILQFVIAPQSWSNTPAREIKNEDFDDMPDPEDK